MKQGRIIEGRFSAVPAPGSPPLPDPSAGGDAAFRAEAELTPIATDEAARAEGEVSAGASNTLAPGTVLVMAILLLGAAWWVFDNVAPEDDD